MLWFFFFYLDFTAQVLKVCRTPGPTACLKLLHKGCLKRWRKEKNSMTGPGQPRTCSHPINARTLTRVCQSECFLFVNFKYIYQDTRSCVVRPKKPARHTVSILTGRKKTQFSHLCSSVIPYPIGTKFSTDVPASYGSLHTKFEENRSSHFRDTSEQNFVLISSFFFFFIFFISHTSQNLP